MSMEGGIFGRKSAFASWEFKFLDAQWPSKYTQPTQKAGPEGLGIVQGSGRPAAIRPTGEVM